MPFFLQGFLSVISKTESLVLTSHRPILFPFLCECYPVDRFPVQKHSKWTSAAVCKWKCATQNPLFLQFGSGGNSLIKMRNHVPVVPESLKDRSFFLMNEHIKVASSFILTSLWLKYYLHTQHPCAVCSLRSLPIATVTKSQLYFQIRLSVLWST